MNKKRLIGIALLGGAALLLAPATSLADEVGAHDGGFFSSPLLSRFLPGTGTPAATADTPEAWNQQLRPTRFRLGFFTTGISDHYESTATASQPATSRPAQLSALASLGYGSYYGASRLDSNRVSLLSDFLEGQGRTEPADESISLSLEAGLQHKALNTGILYAYQSGYPALGGGFGDRPYPSYIFAPLEAGNELARDNRDAEGQAVFLYLGYNLTQQLNLRGTLGLARTGSGSDDGYSLKEQSRRWGVDFAATYRLLDNLVYQAHLGYVSIDDASSSSTLPSLDSTPMSATGSGPDSLYHIGSHIRMTF